MTTRCRCSFKLLQNFPGKLGKNVSCFVLNFVDFCVVFLDFKNLINFPLIEVLSTFANKEMGKYNLRSRPQSHRHGQSCSRSRSTSLNNRRHNSKDRRRTASRVIKKKLDEEITCSVMPNILKLPDEILLKIFQYVSNYSSLKKCGLVCKKWNSLTYDSSLWKKVKFPYESRIKLSDVIRIISYGAENIDFCEIDHRLSLFTDTVNEHFMKRSLENNKLQSITSNICPIVPILLTLSMQFRQLSIYIMSDQICKLVGLNKGLLKLKARFLAEPRNAITPVGIKSLFLNCTQIQDLGLEYGLSTECLNTLWDVIPRSLKCFRFYYDVQDIHVFNIIDCCPTLTKLFFNDKFGISFTSINKIASGLPNIEELHFTFGYFNSSETLPESVTNTSLKTLVIKHSIDIYASHVKHLCLCFPAIKKLSIFKLSLSDSTLDELSNFIPCSVTQLCFHSTRRLSDVHIKKIFQRCSSIVELSIIKCFKLTFAAIHLIKDFTNIEKLTLALRIPLHSMYILKDLGTLKELYLEKSLYNESSHKCLYDALKCVRIYYNINVNDDDSSENND